LSLGQLRKTLWTCSLQADSNQKIGEPGKLPCIGRIMADQNPIRLQDKVKLPRQELQDLQQVSPVEGGFISADPYLFKSFLSGDGRKLVGHLMGRIEPTRLFGLDEDMPGPAEEAS